jgi:hypothetical protein
MNNLKIIQYVLKYQPQQILYSSIEQVNPDKGTVEVSGSSRKAAISFCLPNWIRISAIAQIV